MYPKLTQRLVGTSYSDAIKLRHWSVAAVLLNLAKDKAIRLAWLCKGWHRVCCKPHATEQICAILPGSFACRLLADPMPSLLAGH